MIRHLLEWLHRFLARSYVEVGPPKAARRRATPTPRVIPERQGVDPPPAGIPTRAQVGFDESREFTTSSDGLLVQRAAVDVTLANGKRSRLGVLAAYDPITHEARRITYVPLHEVSA